MSKAFTKETDADDDDEPEKPDVLENKKNYVTPAGLAALQVEYRHLRSVERPKVVETVRWAAGNGDRSENGDYIYGKKRLREIDRRLRYLTKRLETAEVVDTNLQKHLTKVFFGATVTYATLDDEQRTVQIVGIDEANLDQKKISWTSPLAKALFKASVGDEVKFNSPSGLIVLEVIEISYK